MPRRLPRAWLLAVPLFACLYLYGLSSAGLLPPDEPRYASIAREMARSGDWITPRLWGQPWFEKPALLYWMSGAAFRLGGGTELAPRLPVALLAVGFLIFYQRVLQRHFGCLAAWCATAVLGTSAGWIGFAHVGVTDLPLAACFAASMLLALDWVKEGDPRRLPASAALMGAAVLAKGLVPLVLAAPLFWAGRRRWRDLPRLRVLLPFAAVALPWYALCYARNGKAFLVTFFWEHHFERFVSGALLHQRPFWFYVPVLLAGLMPWSPLLLLVLLRPWSSDPRRRFLLLWLAFGFVFFSGATNKLPGYLLPLLPAAAALMGLALAESRTAGRVLAVCALGTVALALLPPVLPTAVAAGLSRAPRPAFSWTWLLPAGLAAVAWALERRGRRLAAVGLISAGMAAGTVAVAAVSLPQLDRAVSARILWRDIASRRDRICLGELNRNWRYGLNYYSEVPLPDCSAQPRPLRLAQEPRRMPVLLAPDGTRLDPF